jgi:hypothetical protein
MPIKEYAMKQTYFLRMCFLVFIMLYIGCNAKPVVSQFTVTVIDCDRQVIPGASVLLENHKQKLLATTNLDGQASFRNVTFVRDQLISVEASGYPTRIHKGYIPKSDHDTITLGTQACFKVQRFYEKDAQGHLALADKDGNLFNVDLGALHKEEPVWCAVFADMIKNDKGDINPVFISLGTNDIELPNGCVLACLKEEYNNVQFVSAARHEDGTYYDAKTGEYGIKLAIVGVYIENNDMCYVIAYNYVGPLGASGYDYILQKKGNEWVIIKKEMTWIS